MLGSLNIHSSKQSSGQAQNFTLDSAVGAQAEKTADKKKAHGISYFNNVSIRPQS